MVGLRFRDSSYLFSAEAIILFTHLLWMPDLMASYMFLFLNRGQLPCLTSSLSDRKWRDVTTGGKSAVVWSMNVSVDKCSCHNLSSEWYS